VAPVDQAKQRVNRLTLPVSRAAIHRRAPHATAESVRAWPLAESLTQEHTIAADEPAFAGQAAMHGDEIHQRQAIAVEKNQIGAPCRCRRAIRAMGARNPSSACQT